MAKPRIPLTETTPIVRAVTYAPENFDEAAKQVERLQKSLELLMLAGHVSPERVNQAFELTPEP